MSATSLGVALDALVNVFGAAMPGVLVIDGPVLDEPSNRDVLTVGYDEDDDTRSVQAERTVAGLGTEREVYDVACVASSWSGSTQVKPIRDRALAMFDTATQCLAANPSLGGVVARARVSFTTLDQAQEGQGCGVSLRFAVHVESFS